MRCRAPSILALCVSVQTMISRNGPIRRCDALRRVPGMVASERDAGRKQRHDPDPLNLRCGARGV